ncbi:hypothetical protein ACFX2I_012442 [Malus domestica]
MIARGIMLGADQPVILHLLDFPPAAEALNGVKMELVDAAFPLLKGVVATTDVVEACTGVNIAVMVGGFPRKEGMERKDVMTKNVSIYCPHASTSFCSPPRTPSPRASGNCFQVPSLYREREKVKSGGLLQSDELAPVPLRPGRPDRALPQPPLHPGIERRVDSTHVHLRRSPRLPPPESPQDLQVVAWGDFPAGFPAGGEGEGEALSEDFRGAVDSQGHDEVGGIPCYDMSSRTPFLFSPDAVKVERPAGVKELENGGCDDWRLMALSLGREEIRGRLRGAGLSLGEPWELTRWSLLAVLGGCAHLLLLPINFSSTYIPTSSISCLAAATNFKDRCQTTSRPRSSSSNSSSPSVFVLPYKSLRQAS